VITNNGATSLVCLSHNIYIFACPFMICQQQSTDSELVFDVNAATSECEMPVMTNKQSTKEGESEWDGGVYLFGVSIFFMLPFHLVWLNYKLSRLPSPWVLPPTISVMSPERMLVAEFPPFISSVFNKNLF